MVVEVELVEASSLSLSEEPGCGSSEGRGIRRTSAEARCGVPYAVKERPAQVIAGTGKPDLRATGATG